jgi:hypothetical protein
MSLPASLSALAIATPTSPRRMFSAVDKGNIVYLSADSKEAMDAAFTAAGIVAPEGQTLPPDFRWPGIGDVCVLGIIYNDDAVYGPPGEDGFPTVVSAATPMPGWHVNVLPPT